VSIAVHSSSAYDSAFNCTDANEIGHVFLRILTGCRHRVIFTILSDSATLLAYNFIGYGCSRNE